MMSFLQPIKGVRRKEDEKVVLRTVIRNTGTREQSLLSTLVKVQIIEKSYKYLTI